MGDMGALQGSLSHSRSRICPLWVDWELDYGPDLSPPAPQDDDLALGSPQNPSPTVSPQPPPSCRGNNCLRWELFPYSCSGRHKPGGGRLSLSSGAAPPPHSGGGRFGGGPGAAVSAISSAGLAAVITIHYRSPLPPKGAGAAPPSQPSLLLPFTLNYLPYYTAAWRETKSQGSGQAGSRQRAGGQRAGSGQAAGRQAQLGRK